MGGTIPLGYDVKDRKLVINPEEAARVRLIFQRYLALGCVSQLRDDLRQRGVLSKQRILTSGRVLGGCWFGRGALYHLLQNRTYLGEVVHKGAAYPGEQDPIIDDELWNAVQTKLEANRGVRRRSHIETGALLGGLFFDDRGNLMSPTYSIRRGNRYRYYISRALVRGDKKAAGSHGRVGATDVERLVVETLSQQLCRPELMNDVAAGIWGAQKHGRLCETLLSGSFLAKARSRSFAGFAAASQSSVEAGEGEAPTIYTVPAPIPQPRARRKIIAPGGGSNSTPRRLNE